MGVVVSVMTKWMHGEQALTMILELPEGMDLDAALSAVERGEEIQSRRLRLEKLDYSPEILGLPPSADRERVRLIKSSSPWSLRPGTVQTIRNWRGSRIARMEE